jgi:ABC-type multidrug transport system ATPase subunit
MIISLEDVSARSSGGRSERGNAFQPAARIDHVSLTWETGVLAILGAPADGTTTLLDVLAGTERVRSGGALVAGKPPAESRVKIAYVPLEPMLPDALRVEELCALASEIRGEPKVTATSRLEPLGIAKLMGRRIRSLSPGEIRAVALAIALSSRAPVVLIEEPLAGLDSAAPAKVVAAVRARATAGAAVIVTTASVRDATSLGDQLGILTKGVFTQLPASHAHVGTAGAKLRVVVAANTATDVAPFVAALANEPAITSVDTAAFAASRVLHAAVTIVVSGPDLLAIARAVGAAASSTGAKVEAIESAVMPLESIRSRLAAPRSIPAPPLPPPPVPPAPPAGAE